MVDNTEEMLAGSIAAIIPAYEPNVGDVTKIINRNGDEYIAKKKIKTVLIRLAHIYALDLTASRRKYASIIGQRNVIPIPFSEHMILIPFKMRKPIAENDGSLGYINLVSIQVVEKAKENNCVEIVLENKIRIKCMVSYATAYKHIKNAQIVKQHYLGLHLGTSHLQSVSDMYSQYDQPATKTDIALLTTQIMELKNYLTKYSMPSIIENDLNKQ
ncbi:MAG: hypothetical protein PWR27_1827 [Petroclostridium sp.]|jgi:hypothetical protein|uniref:hypothetical protein n=1 Tax=Petroclostridium xylanilyticum TaxID=1792311 RepID=UPI000B9966C5|nr:hypothetical protein [Petroclostridium xylanilyticum]MBZ4646357.1 hypothetical protein [Clostridia bacterium]MDK2811118.1 hypothetical protein [Petroclostridium sp.]